MMSLNTTLRRLARVALIVPFVVALPAAGQSVINEDLKLTAGGVSSVAISGTTAILGASGAGPGQACLFGTTTGQQIMYLADIDDPDSFGEAFGSSVGISGNFAIVGDPLGNDAGPNSGTAHLFDITDTAADLTLIHIQLSASDSGANSRFGSSVAISGHTAIVGAPSAIGSNLVVSGAAYLFEINTDNCSRPPCPPGSSSAAQSFKLIPLDGANGDAFGWSVAISGTTAIVGARSHNGGSGAAYLFSTTTGQQMAKLTAFDAASGDRFGGSVAISATTAIVGTSSGSAYLFDVSVPSSPVQGAKLTTSDGSGPTSVAIHGTKAVVGTPFGDGGGSSSGSAYVFDIITGQQLAKLAASDAAADDFFGSGVAMSDTTLMVDTYVFDGSTINILQQPQNNLVLPGETVPLNVEAANAGAIESYQWRRDGVDLIDGAGVSGTNTPNLQVVATESEVGLYDCVITRSPFFLGGLALSTATDQVILAVRPDPDACYPDANGDGVLNFFDVSQFIIEFGRGCP